MTTQLLPTLLFTRLVVTRGRGGATRRHIQRPFSSSSVRRTTTQPRSHSTTAAAGSFLTTRAARVQDAAAPSRAALRSLFVYSSIPMVGFGFMDNVVMIQAGQLIDSTLGVQLGLATMTAAAAGQVVSDVSGVLFGGTLERILRLNTPAMTVAQRQLPISRNVSLLGAVVGVIVGCALGATTLLFVDLEARDRMQLSRQLRDIVSDMNFPAATCTIYVLDESAVDESTSSSSLSNARTCLKFLRSRTSSPGMQQCLESQQVVRQGDDCLYAPVVELGDGALLAVLEFRQEHDDFSDQQVDEVKSMCHHLAIVLKHLAK